MLLTIFAFILHSATLLHPIWRQSGVVGVHREKTQRWIVLKRTAIAGF